MGRKVSTYKNNHYSLYQLNAPLLFYIQNETLNLSLLFSLLQHKKALCTFILLTVVMMLANKLEGPYKEVSVSRY